MRLRKVFLSMLFVAFFLWLHFWLRAWMVATHDDTTLCNPGGPFGVIFPVWLLIAFSCGIVLLLLGAWLKEKGVVFGWLWLLILSGGLGNLLERILFGCIIDYVALPFFPVFNLADVLLTIGTIGILWGARSKKQEKDSLNIRNE
ncbi:MAG: signal peptidase II [Candidatus Moraniibacteriota bacterium]